MNDFVNQAYLADQCVYTTAIIVLYNLDDKCHLIAYKLDIFLLYIYINTSYFICKYFRFFKNVVISALNKRWPLTNLVTFSIL